MKRPQKNFVVEYKGGNRRQIQKPASIWGSLDLKSISRDVEAEAPSESRPASMRSSIRHSESEQNKENLLTPATGQQKTPLPPQEGHMAEETTTVVSPDSTSADTVLSTPEKKRRGPRKKNVPLDAIHADISAKTPENKKEPRKTRVKLAKAPPPTSESSDPAKKPRKARVQKSTSEAKTSAVAEDQMADLLQLEEENRNLRKLLAEKLRAENADLRKRLGHS